MTLQERFATLTTEQRDQFKAVKTAEQLEIFIVECKLEISDEEKAQILEYIDKGVLPLADEELENVAGGGCGTPQPPPSMICGTCNGNNFKYVKAVYPFVYFVCTTCKREHKLQY